MSIFLSDIFVSVITSKSKYLAWSLISLAICGSSLMTVSR